MEQRPLISSRDVVRIVLTIVGIAIGLYVLYVLRKPISWVVLAGFIAITLSGPVNRLARHMRRGFAIAIVYLGIVVLVPATVGIIVVPPMVTQATHLAQRAPQYAQDVEDYVQRKKRLRNLDKKYDVTGKISDEANRLPGRVGDAAPLLADIGVVLVNSVFALINILILSIFLVASGRRWLDVLIEWRAPEEADRLKRLADRVGRTIGSYVGGALVQALLAAVVAFGVMEALGIPFAAPLAVLTFFADLIPVVGATIAAVLVGVITVFAGFPTTTIIWTVFAIVYQQTETSVITPQIQKRALQVHPFAVFVGVLCGATLFGVFGALLAIPVFASAQIAVSEYFAYRRDQDKPEVTTGGGLVLTDAESR